MAYRAGSGWSDKIELECLLILRICEREGFPRGLQVRLCRELERKTNKRPSYASLNAKVGNYKSLAGITNDSRYSSDSKRLFNLYKDSSIEELKSLIDK